MAIKNSRILRPGNTADCLGSDIKRHDQSLIFCLSFRDIEWFGDVFGPEDALDLGAVVEVETEKEDRQEEELFSQKGTNDNFEDDDIEEVDMDMTEASAFSVKLFLLMSFRSSAVVSDLRGR